MYVANLLKSITTIKSVRGVYAFALPASSSLMRHVRQMTRRRRRCLSPPPSIALSHTLCILLLFSPLPLSSRVFANVAYAVNSLPPWPSMPALALPPSLMLLPLLLPLLPFSFWQQAHKIFYTLLLACPFWHGLGQRLCSSSLFTGREKGNGRTDWGELVAFEGRPGGSSVPFHFFIVAKAAAHNTHTRAESFSLCVCVCVFVGVHTERRHHFSNVAIE